MQKALDELGIPWFDSSTLTFSHTWEAEIALAVLQLSYDSNSSDSLYSLMTAIEDSVFSYQFFDRDALDIACEIRDRLSNSKELRTDPGDVWKILEISGFLDSLEPATGNSSETNRLIENVHDVTLWVRQEGQVRGCGLEDLIKVLTGQDAVQLLTSHGSKGKEYDYVFFIGVEDNIIPAGWRDLSEEELSEERRIFYVTLTRTRRERYTLVLRKE